MRKIFAIKISSQVHGLIACFPSCFGRTMHTHTIICLLRKLLATEVCCLAWRETMRHSSTEQTAPARYYIFRNTVLQWIHVARNRTFLVSTEACTRGCTDVITAPCSGDAVEMSIQTVDAMRSLTKP